MSNKKLPYNEKINKILNIIQTDTQLENYFMNNNFNFDVEELNNISECIYNEYQNEEKYDSIINYFITPNCVDLLSNIISKSEISPKTIAEKAYMYQLYYDTEYFKSIMDTYSKGNKEFVIDTMIQQLNKIDHNSRYGNIYLIEQLKKIKEQKNKQNIKVKKCQVFKYDFCQDIVTKKYKAK